MNYKIRNGANQKMILKGKNNMKKLLLPAIFVTLTIFLTACADSPDEAKYIFPEDTEEYVPDTDTIMVDQAVYAGLRSSEYGAPSPFPKPDYFESAAKEMASKIEIDPKAVPAFVWIVGMISGHDDRTCALSFPADKGAHYKNISFNSEDMNEKHLDYFDKKGAKVWLQVESASASVDDLIDLVLKRYGHHKSVIGFGVDVEWFRYNKHSDPSGVAITDVKAKRWAHKVRSYNKNYLLFFKHWEISMMPRDYRNGIMFLNDSQGLNSLTEMIDEFKRWGKYFSPARVGFQFGYATDKEWWKKLNDPPSDIANAIVKHVPGARDFYWVDFTMTDIWPVK